MGFVVVSIGFVVVSDVGSLMGPGAKKSIKPSIMNAVPTKPAVFCLPGSTVILPASDPAIARTQNTIPATIRMVGNGVWLRVLSKSFTQTAPLEYWVCVSFLSRQIDATM